MIHFLSRNSEICNFCFYHWPSYWLNPHWDSGNEDQFSQWICIGGFLLHIYIMAALSKELFKQSFTSSSLLSCCSSRHGLPSHPASCWLLHPQTHLCPSNERLELLSRGKQPTAFTLQPSLDYWKHSIPLWLVKLLDTWILHNSLCPLCIIISVMKHVPFASIARHQLLVRAKWQCRVSCCCKRAALMNTFISPDATLLHGCSYVGVYLTWMNPPKCLIAHNWHVFFFFFGGLIMANYHAACLPVWSVVCVDAVSSGYLVPLTNCTANFVKTASFLLQDSN